MASKDKNLTPVQQEYKKFEQEREPETTCLKKLYKSLFRRWFYLLHRSTYFYFYITYFDFTERSAGNPTVATLIFISMLLTGFGIYDRFGQFAGAGTAVPVTGFGNSVIAACIEHRTEGFVLGVGGNMFKLAGSVILFGVFSAFVIALIKTILVQWGGL